MVLNPYPVDTHAYTVSNHALQTEVAPAVIVIDDFDDGLDAAWSGDRAEFANDTTTMFEGAGSVRTSTALSRVDVTSTTGLPAYFAHGERMKLYIRATATGTSGPGQQTYFAYVDSNNWWRTELNYSTGNFEMTKFVAGAATDVATATVSVGANTWYELIITRDDGSFGGLNYDLSAELIDTSTSTSLATLSTNDSNHETADGLRHELFALGDGDCYLDYQHKP